MQPQARVRSKGLPPPQKLTAIDVYRVLLGIVAVPLGAILLYRSALIGLSVPAVLVSTAFIGFGIYRTWFAWHRLRELRSEQSK